ncbi:MAG TPA: DUF2513 domain-containing protein [Anaerolineales bacterium]|nr:DUF2513 domain-containing protein [Anaerolineales bacterium]
MKRSIELVRLILFAMEDSDTPVFSTNTFPKISGYSEKQISHHIKIMTQANLLHCDKETSRSEYKHRGVLNPVVNEYKYEYYSISWQGYEFLDAFRDEVRWGAVKNIMEKAGGFYVEIALDIAKNMAKKDVARIIN